MKSCHHLDTGDKDMVNPTHTSIISLMMARQDALLPTPTGCLTAMRRLLPDLGADLFQGFINEVQEALSRLQAQNSAVEDYVEKIQFLTKVSAYMPCISVSSARLLWHTKNLIISSPCDAGPC